MCLIAFSSIFDGQNTDCLWIPTRRFLHNFKLDIPASDFVKVQEIARLLQASDIAYLALFFTLVIAPIGKSTSVHIR